MFQDGLVTEIVQIIKEDFKKEENCTSYGEPQAFYYLENKRSIEVVIEQEGLAANEYFYSVTLHCNGEEFDSGHYNKTNGIIERYSSAGLDEDELIDLVSAALVCNDYERPVIDEKLSDQELEEEGSFKLISRKSVPDADGFITEYTMYRNLESGEYVFVFGDSDIYTPESGSFDWRCDSEAAAWEWFNSYEGFTDEKYHADAEDKLPLDTVIKSCEDMSKNSSVKAEKRCSDKGEISNENR